MVYRSNRTVLILWCWCHWMTRDRARNCIPSTNAMCIPCIGRNCTSRRRCMNSNRNRNRNRNRSRSRKKKKKSRRSMAGKRIQWKCRKGCCCRACCGSNCDLSLETQTANIYLCRTHNQTTVRTILNQMCTWKIAHSFHYSVNLEPEFFKSTFISSSVLSDFS